jgi:hypothetical protein
MSDTDPPTAFPAAHDLDATIVRGRIADDARAAVGTGSTGSEERQNTYANRLFPDTPDARVRAQMADTMYSCGLSGLAAMRASLVDAPEMHEDYHTHIGAALEWLASIAQRMHAYRSLQMGHDCDGAIATFEPGDILVVESPVHVIVLTDYARNVVAGAEDSDDFITSEGGMPEIDEETKEHGMCIHSRRLRLRQTASGRIQTGTVNDDGTVTWGRLAIYLIDGGKLLTTDGL